MFFNKTSINKSIKQMDDVAISNRKIIDRKMKEVKSMNLQLDQAIFETKELTAALQKKLSTRLKITRKTISSICQNIKEGIVILNSFGDVVETNSSFRKTFLGGEEAIGKNFKEICTQLNPTYEDGKKFSLTPNFRDLAEEVFTSKKKTSIQSEIMLRVNPKNQEFLKCNFSLEVLENSPEQVNDVSFILFFRCLKRSVDRDRRIKIRELAF